MNKLSNRNNSNSPSRSADFTSKHRPFNKINKQAKSKEDVQVFTSLPPNVEGEIKFYLRFKILNINLNETTTNKQQINKKLNSKPEAKNDNLIARCLWWGEENSNGSIFRPKIQSKLFKTDAKLQTTALFMVRSGSKQFNAYLNDMKTLDIDLINETTMQTIGKVQLFEIGQLSVINPIKGYYSAFDESQKKVADVNISIELESLKDKKQTDLSDHSRPVTPTSQANINEFQSKYEQFEKNQLKKTSLTDNKNKFNSITYKTDRLEYTEHSTNPIITNLIQRAEKLKNEMIKSSNCNLYEPSLVNGTDSFNYFDEDEQLNTSLSYEPSYLFDKFDYLNTDEMDNDDKELKELLHPTDLFTKLIDKKTNNQLIFNDHKEILYKHEQPQRPYSTTNSLYSSDDEQDKPTNRNHVSFEIQSSSDGESSTGSIDNDTNCVDCLSDQRLSLLNLVQIARLKIDNIDFYSSFSNSFMKSIENNPTIHLSETKFNSKPPKAIKTDMNQLFFIEYQFPVIATNRFNSDELLNATQVMRAVPKRSNKHSLLEDKIQFDHNADYSVLFSSKSLESWWRSHIVFRIYLRTQNSSKTSLASSTAPKLIGVARLKLRNLLKSRNFRLIKKLAILDQWKQPTDKYSQKRIGTLNVTIELSSDLNEFLINLQKLKSTENNKTFYRAAKSAQSKQSIQVKPPVEPTYPIEFHLTVNDNRGFTTSTKNSLYLICRLFWNKEKVKLETNSNLNWSLNLSLTLNKSLIDNMRNNFMIVEAWSQSSNNSSDSLIGTIKLPLHEFYIKFNETNLLSQFLNDAINHTQPVIGTSGWISVLDPFTGFKSGELNILLAMGSNKQILNLTKILFDQSRVKMSKPSNHDLVEHIFSISLNQIKLQQTDTLTGDETDYFVKYSFLNGNDFKFDSFIISSKLNTNFDNKLEHKFQSKERNKEFTTLISNRYDNNKYIRFELWKRSYFPNLREKYLARGELPVDNILNLVLTNQSKDSSIIPLVLNETEDIIGHLSIDIEYNYFNNLPKSEIIKPNNNLNDSSDVILSIGILRANRVQTLIKSMSSRTDMHCFNLENSEIYIKYSLAFINKPLDFKQTHKVATQLNGYSPEFFDYFEVNCPLIAVYNSFNKRTISLAEQLELGQIIFEIWSKLNDSKDTEILLGTCVVPLDALLDNRIGIRGWLPIQTSFKLNESKQTALSENSLAGGLEIAIRFTKHDDYLKVLQSAKEIGWLNNTHLINETKSVPQLKIPIIDNITTETETKSKKFIKCLIEIDKAVHLPTLYDRELNKEIPVNSFVSFNTNLDNLSDVMSTTVCDQDLAPKWNQQFLANIDSEYFLDDKKYFILKIWHKSSQNYDKLLGCASIDLTPLIYGLSHLSGWYNIQDSIGTCNGQIKLNILPQENLFALKQISSARKRQNNEIKTSSFNSRYDTINCSTLSLPRLYSTDVPAKDLKMSNSTNDLTDRTINLDEYKSGLKQKLTELEQLNKKLKERLQIGDIIKQVSMNSEEQMNENEQLEISVHSDHIVLDELEIIEKNRLKEDETTDKPIDECSFQKIEDLTNNESKICDEPVNKIPLNVIDSFWVNSANEDSETSEKEASFREQEIEHLEPVVQDEIIILADTNETFLDQTFNFNASLDIAAQNRIGNESPVETIEQYEFIDTNIIDCNKFDDNNDENDNNEQVILDQFEEEIIIDENEDEDDITIIMPEEINKIDEIKVNESSPVSKIIEPQEVPIKDRFKDLNTKIPNYFLLQDDLETKMKKLHHSYSQINSVSENNEKLDKVKFKSTLNIINSSTNHDLDRINKIFHTKFN